MTAVIEINGFRLVKQKAAPKHHELARADVAFPEFGMAVNDVRLTWSVAQGFKAKPPFSAVTGGRASIQWYPHTDFAKLLAERLRETFEALGGKLPEPDNDNLRQEQDETFMKALA